MEIERSVFTVGEFCGAFRMGRSTLYQLWYNGQGPESYLIGRSRRISVDAARRWREARESAVATGSLGGRHG